MQESQKGLQTIQQECDEAQEALAEQTPNSKQQKRVPDVRFKFIYLCIYLDLRQKQKQQPQQEELNQLKLIWNKPNPDLKKPPPSQREPANLQRKVKSTTLHLISISPPNNSFQSKI